MLADMLMLMLPSVELDTDSTAVNAALSACVELSFCVFYLHAGRSGPS